MTACGGIKRPLAELARRVQEAGCAHLTQAAHRGGIGAMMLMDSAGSAQGMPAISPLLLHAAGLAIMRSMTAASGGQAAVTPLDEAQVAVPATLDREPRALASSMADELAAADQARQERDGSRTFRRQPPTPTGQ